MKIKGLSLTRPWSFAFVGGPEDLRKRVENRTWFPPKGMMGHFVALHSAKSYSETDREFISRVMGVEAPVQTASPHSQIFAVARIVCVVTGVLDPRLVESQKQWFFGPFGWVLDDFIELCRPVTCAGAQKLWDIPSNVLPGLRDSYRQSVPGGMFPQEPIEWEHPAKRERMVERILFPRTELSDWERKLQD